MPLIYSQPIGLKEGFIEEAGSPFDKGGIVPVAFGWIWSSKVCKKIKVFTCLMLRDRINSRNLLRRKNFVLDNDDFSCILCDQNTEETTYHLIFECPFSQRCWDYLHIHWNHSRNFFMMLTVAKQQSGIRFPDRPVSHACQQNIIVSLTGWGQS